jgi:hypothetical protein
VTIASQGVAMGQLKSCMTHTPDWKRGIATTYGAYSFLTAVPPADGTGDGLIDLFMRRVSESDRFNPQTAMWSAQSGEWDGVEDPDHLEFQLLHPGDFNGDGQADLVGANSSERGKLGVFLGPISSGLTELDLLARGHAHAQEITSLDWDQDGRDDVVVALGSPQGVIVFRSDP